MIIRTIVPEYINSEHIHYTYAHVLEDEQYPFYIGLGSQVKKSTKYSRAKSISGRNSDWKNKTKDKNYYVIICTSSNNYSLEKLHEIECIAEVGKEKEGGLLVNIADGGEGCRGYKHTPEHILKLKERYSGSNNPMYGKLVSSETRKRMSLSQKGRHHNDKTKIILSEKAIKRGYKGPIKGEHGRSRKVKQIDPITKQVVEVFDTLRLAAEKLNVTDNAIGRACRLKFKVKKFNWEYVEKTK